MKIPSIPSVTRLAGVTPKDGYCGAVYSVQPGIVMDSGVVHTHVTTSFGLETVLGTEDTFAVFPSDEHGKIDWSEGAIYQESEGPGWCVDLLRP